MKKSNSSITIGDVVKRKRYNKDIKGFVIELGSENNCRVEWTSSTGTRKGNSLKTWIKFDAIIKS